MKTEEQNAPDITEESTDQLAASDSQESEDWTPDDLNEEQRAQYDRGVAAVDAFLSDERTKAYEPTDANRAELLAFLESYDLPLSFEALYVAFQILSEAGELELKSEQEDQGAAEEQADVSARLATAKLARGTKGVEPEEAEESEPEEPKTARGKPVAWRNGRRVGVGS